MTEYFDFNGAHATARRLLALEGSQRRQVMDSSTTKDKLGQRDIVVNFDDPQIKELLVHVDRAQGAPIVYANLSKFSRLGVDFVLDLVQIDPAELHLVTEAARKLTDKPSQLNMPGKVVARILMGPILVKNVRDQADQILQGVEIKQPAMEDSPTETQLSLVASNPANPIKRVQ